MAKEIIEYFFQMVKIDSESGEEQKFLKFLENLFQEELGAKTQYDNYGNLIININAKNSQKEEPILFCGHADTVKPGKGIEPVLKKGVIYSNGATILGADDKAGIAELLMALKKANKYPPIEILITRQEEMGLSGSSFVDKNLIKAKKGYVLDTEALEEIVIGGPSRIEMMVKIIGKSAHAVEPEHGISAIEIAALAISLLKTGWIDPITTVNVGLIEGGQVINAVPETATIQLECRSQNHKKCLEQCRLIKNTFQTVAKAKGAKTEIQIKHSMKASRISENTEVVRVAKKAIQSIGLKPEVKVICGGTDATNLNQKGIITAVLGTGSKLPHSTDEYIAINEMEQAVNILITILGEFS
ncbi:MAG: M20/M25/M40 family metallo-hydrolase [Candidatus Atribacteria bacterium]|nr:M20/M25/M40 family metallo-hydrolase [Candidatus Atribacteria bacterium]